MGLLNKTRFKRVGEGSVEFKFPVDDYGNSMNDADNLKDVVISVQEKLDAIGASAEYEIIIPQPNEIQIDYDYPELPLIFPKLLEIFARAMGSNLNYTIYCSMSGNRHVVIECRRDLTDMERIAWQAVFASDPRREALSLMRLSKGLANPSLLIHRKDGTDVLQTETYVLERPEGRKFR